MSLPNSMHPSWASPNRLTNLTSQSSTHLTSKSIRPRTRAASSNALAWGPRTFTPASSRPAEWYRANHRTPWVAGEATVGTFSTRLRCRGRVHPSQGVSFTISAGFALLALFREIVRTKCGARRYSDHRVLLGSVVGSRQRPLYPIFSSNPVKWPMNNQTRKSANWTGRRKLPPRNSAI